jgi:hypothetical protein
MLPRERLARCIAAQNSLILRRNQMQTQKVVYANSAGSVVRPTGSLPPRKFLSVVPVILLMLIWPFGGGSKVAMTNSQAVPGAKGVLHVSHDSNNNTKVVMNVQYLAQPSALTPSAVAYVVWVQANGHSPENKGELQIGSNRSGNITIVTPYKQFTIFVTAEQSPQVREPSGERVLSAQVSQ